MRVQQKIPSIDIPLRLGEVCGGPADLAGPAIAPARVRAELWRSLVSMLRVYSGAASLTHGEFAVEEAEGVVTVEHKGYWIRLTFHPQELRTEWSTGKMGTVETHGSFEIQEDGLLNFGGGRMEMDQAAIEWVEDLVRAVGVNRAPVPAPGQGPIQVSIQEAPPGSDA